MDIKINIVNDPYTKISPLAFGATFSNLSEYVLGETAEEIFENMGVFKGKTITDYEGLEYKILSISELNKFENPTDETVYKVNIKRL